MDTLDIKYDYAIIGAGAAGLQLCLAMLSDPFFSGKRLVIFEKESKIENDKTWCFWEEPHGKWDHLIQYQWKQGEFITTDKKVTFNLNPYVYKKLDSADFYAFANKHIRIHKNSEWIQTEVIRVVEKELVEIHTKEGLYLAGHVFDSRIDPEFFKDTSSKKVWQHFKGWEIETDEDYFSPDRFTMMDFRVKWPDSTSFTYVLPFSPRSALVEFTFFTPFLVKDEDYDTYLEKYLKEILFIPEYRINRVERGVIPMSDYPFHRHHTKKITKIGTAGGWVRPSSGYSFKNADSYVGQLLSNIRSGKKPHRRIAKSRFRLYDTIFLDLLEKYNAMGERHFTDMYTKNPIQQIFKFLDEKSTFLEEVSIISKFQTLPFLKAAIRQVNRLRHIW